MTRVLALGIALIVIAIAIIAIMAVLQIAPFDAMRLATERAVAVLAIGLAAVLAVGGLLRLTRAK